MPGLTSNSLADLDRAYVPVVEAIVTSCNAQLAPSSMRVIVHTDPPPIRDGARPRPLESRAGRRHITALMATATRGPGLSISPGVRQPRQLYYAWRGRPLRPVRDHRQGHRASAGHRSSVRRRLDARKRTACGPDHDHVEIARVAHMATGYTGIERAVTVWLRIGAAAPVWAVGVILTGAGMACAWLASQCWAAGIWLTKDG